ncbi:MAG: hypothetical protein U0792_15115 [Gemmataceae bacterium]
MKLYDRAAGDAPEVWWKWQDESCNTAAFSPDGRMLAAGFTGTGRLRVWSMTEKKEISFGDRCSRVTRVEARPAFSKDGRLLAGSSDDGWATRAGRPRLNVSTGAGFAIHPTQKDEKAHATIRGVAFASDSKTLAAAERGRLRPVHRHLEGDSQHVKSIQVGQSILDAAFSSR